MMMFKCDKCGATFYSSPKRFKTLDLVINILLIFLTGGLWLIPFIFLMILVKKKVKCPYCGKVIKIKY